MTEGSAPGAEGELDGLELEEEAPEPSTGARQTLAYAAARHEAGRLTRFPPMTPSKRALFLEELRRARLVELLEDGTAELTERGADACGLELEAAEEEEEPADD